MKTNLLELDPVPEAVKAEERGDVGDLPLGHEAVAVEIRSRPQPMVFVRGFKQKVSLL